MKLTIIIDDSNDKAQISGPKVCKFILIVKITILLVRRYKNG